MRINISEVNWEKLKSATVTGLGLGFDMQSSDAAVIEEYPTLTHTIEISDDIAERLTQTYEDDTDCTFDEPVWQFDEAIRCLLDRKEAGKLN